MGSAFTQPAAAKRPLLLAVLLLAVLAACTGGGDGPDATPPEPGVVEFIAFAGQSNAGNGGLGLTVEAQPRFANVYQFAGPGKAGLGSVSQNPLHLQALELAQDAPGGPGQWAQTLAGFAIADAVPGTEYLLRTDWFGGQPIASFLPGSTHFANTVQALAAGRALVARSGRRLHCHWYVWIQDEASSERPESTTAQLSSYIRDMQEAFKSTLGQQAPPTFVLLQPNSWDSPGVYGYDVAFPDGIAQGQWELSLSQAGVLMAGPSYQAPLIATRDDGIHPTALGRMVIGDMLAAVKAAGPGFKPLQPSRVTVNGRQLEIHFEVPAQGLQWDTSWVAATPSRGFSYADESGSTTIEAVDIVSASVVRITLSAAPVGTQARILYAQGLLDDVLDGWAAGRGQLISPTARESFFHRLGYPVPRFVHHYAVRFSLPVPWARR